MEANTYTGSYWLVVLVSCVDILKDEVVGVFPVGMETVTREVPVDPITDMDTE